MALPFLMISSFSRCCGACLTAPESRAGLAQYPRWIMSWSFGHLSTHQDSAGNPETRLQSTVENFRFSRLKALARDTLREVFRQPPVSEMHHFRLVNSPLFLSQKRSLAGLMTYAARIEEVYFNDSAPRKQNPCQAVLSTGAGGRYLK